MEGSGENFVLLQMKKHGAVFAKVKTAPENSLAPITNPRVDVSVTNSSSSDHQPESGCIRHQQQLDIEHGRSSRRAN
jgi:hypothetical protein